MNVPATAATDNGKRKRGFLILGGVVVVVGLVYGAYWFLSARFYESTDDAYVASDIVQITSEIPGTVLGVRVDDTQRVVAGQALIELDPADAKVRVAAAEADLARAVRQVRGLYAQADQLRAQISERTIELKQSQEDYARRATLVSDGAVSGEELAHSRDAITRVKSALEGARQQLDATTAQIEGTTISTHPDVLAAAARYHEPLSRCAGPPSPRRSTASSPSVACSSGSASRPARRSWRSCRSTTSGWTRTSRKASCATCASASR